MSAIADQVPPRVFSKEGICISRPEHLPQGKLMLVFGDMDDNVSPGLTIRMIDALTKANKSYDLMIVPNGSHAMMANPYFRRRRWDYFIQHLLGRTPPENYQVTTPSEYPWISGSGPRGQGRP